ncbi:RdgB/HAM1 family non-canonical purine NTP pyrophosphatase [Solimicrobium silvestre]|uniref:dITP/XTP pyrophosphatase n=1 Tax=Solimicrobium silvestre TaxID=2099400 RepID=A0A2S9GXA4_9BURK|nr:RdgB/HAM1 family non-canonical purine NTP pyrophosphatase [Solimicrobium silvestre]PRC92354.1 non-canonical purine NTP pyrophosphatase [Solimicrobium silvestre]
MSKLMDKLANKLILASGNLGKLKELSAMLAPLGIEVHTQTSFGVSEAEEPFNTFIENALTKARHAARSTGFPALADDSGLCVNALGGEPGVQSARFAGEPKSDARNNQKLVAALSNLDDKTAYYYSVCVLVRHADDPQPIIADGRWNGEICAEPRGTNGFGYDAHFWLPELGKTAAELAPEQKNQLSHRGLAMRQLLEKLTEL